MTKHIQDDLRDQLLGLLAEPVEAARSRESTTFDSRVGAHASRLLLFGAGNIGRRTLSILRKSGQEPLGFMDNNPELWGRKIEGVEVFRPSEAARRFDPAKVGVVVTIWCGEATDKMADRIEPLRCLGFGNMALFGHLAWKYPDAFLPHYALDLPSRALQQVDRITKAFDLFEDRRSREIFLSHIRWRLHLDYDALPVPVGDVIYFNSRLILPSANDSLVDGGAFTGDTVESFLGTFGQRGFHRVWSFEPDPRNFEKLQQYVASLPGELRGKVIPLPCAVGEQSSVINVENSGAPSSRVGHGDYQVSCRMIDELIEGDSTPSFIKLDIEGYEPQALRGARQTMVRGRPVLTVCVYHVQDHLWSIPLQISDTVEDYRYTLVPHLSDGWDLVLYAVPRERVPTKLVTVS
jgi:FkbM family methyltransferase